MGFHIQLDLKAIEQAPSVARAAGITYEAQIVGLVEMFKHVWTEKSEHATRELLCGWFGVQRSQVERLVEAEIAFGHLSFFERDSQVPMPSGVLRIRGAHRYSNLRKALSEGGKKSKGNLKQYQEPAAPASTSSSESGPGAPSTPAPKGTRALSAQEECWDVLEHLRVEHCVARGLPPGESKRPKLCNLKLNEACEAAGILDTIDGADTFTRWDMLTLLFERYLAQDSIGVKHPKTGEPCNPPWPLELFLSPNVLGRFKREYDEEYAA